MEELILWILPSEKKEYSLDLTLHVKSPCLQISTSHLTLPDKETLPLC